MRRIVLALAGALIVLFGGHVYSGDASTALAQQLRGLVFAAERAALTPSVG
jgi:hypothetical protein